MKIINFIKKNWFITILIILSICPIVWFYGKGDILITGLDTNFPLDPLVWFKRRFFVWNSTINAGTDFSSSTSGLFFHLIQVVPYLLNISLRNVEIFSIIFWFSAIVISSYILSRLVVPKNKIAQLVIVLLYSVNIYLFNTWENIKVSNISLYVSLPIFISVIYLTLNKKISYKKASLFFVIGSFLASGSGINPAYFSVIVLGIILFGLFQMLSKKSFVEVFKICGLSLSILLLINSFWMFPLLHFLYKNNVTIVSDLGFTNWLESLSENTSLVNVMRLQGAWDWYSLDKYGMPEYLPYTLNYLYKWPFIIFSFVPAILAILSLLFYQKEKKAWYIFFGFLMLLGIFLGAGSHYPTGSVFLLLVKYVPLFSFYRSPWYIFTPFLTISYACLIGLLFDKFSVSLKKKFILPLNIVIFGFLISYCFYNYPLITGKIFRPSRKEGFYINFPNYVFETKEFLLEQDNFSQKRIFTYPDDQIENFNWGYRGTDSIINLFSDKELITPAFNVQSKVFQKILDKIYRSLKEKEFESALSILNVFSVDTIFYKNDTSTLSPKLDFIGENIKKEKIGEWTFFTQPFKQEKIFSPLKVYLDYSNNDSSLLALSFLKTDYAILDGLSDSQVELLGDKENYLSIKDVDLTGSQRDNLHSYSFEVLYSGNYLVLLDKKFVSDKLIKAKLDNLIVESNQIVEDGVNILIGPKFFSKGKHSLELEFPPQNNLFKVSYNDIAEIPSLKINELPTDLSKTMVLYNSEEEEKEIKIPVSSFNPYVNYSIEMDYKYFYGSVPIIDIVQSSPSSPVKTYPMDVGSSFDWQHIEEVFKPIATDSKLEIVIKLPSNKEGDKSKTYLENISIKRTYDNELVLLEKDTEKLLEVPAISFTKKTPVRYEVKVSNAQKGYFLAFLESYNSGWVLERTKGGKVFKIPHFKINGYANGWYLPAGESDQELVIRYKPQRLFIVGLIISSSVLILVLVLNFLARRKRK
ncbi:hypothetical protein ACFL15_00740 [Patescibacteria group bacterium]